MKKLMIAAAVAALAGVTFAGNIYDYKASVKYVDIKVQSSVVSGVKYRYYVKQVKNASLTGYFVPSADCCCTLGTGDGLKPGFLVVQNKSKKSGVKILPANLLAKIWTPKLGKAINGFALEAEGYLFAGLGKAAVPAAASPAYTFGDSTTRGTYHLFGAYNEQNPESQAFVDAWLDAAGFGKAKYEVEDSESGCVIGHEEGYCVSTLSGSVIGGMFLCTASTIPFFNEGTGEVPVCQSWDGTTDVISGTWQIKSNLKINPVAWSDDEIETLSAFDYTNEADQKELTYVKAAAQKITAKYTMLAVDDAFVAAWF